MCVSETHMYSLEYIVCTILSHLDAEEYEVFWFDGVSRNMFARILAFLRRRTQGRFEVLVVLNGLGGTIHSFKSTTLDRRRVDGRDVYYIGLLDYDYVSRRLCFRVCGPLLNQYAEFPVDVCGRCGKIMNL